MYGVTCTSNCTTCALHGSVTGDGCASRDATCACDAGWSGSDCSSCATGWYGAECAHNCSTCELHGSVTGDGCGSRNAMCSCHFGWSGSVCNNTVASPHHPCTGPTTGHDHSCAIRGSDEHAICWGANSQGSSTPPSPSQEYTMLSAGREFTIGVLSSDNTVGCVLL